MIFITTGTTQFPFHRMDQLVLGLSQRFPEQRILYQNYNSELARTSDHLQLVSELPYNRFLEKLKAAAVVITHAGPGSVHQIVCNTATKPVVIPRLHRYGEHVNDHQLHFFEYLHQLGVVGLSNPTPTMEAVQTYIKNPVARVGKWQRRSRETRIRFQQILDEVFS